MKTILAFFTVCLFTTSVWAQKQPEQVTVITEKRQGKVMRIEKHQKTDVVSEGVFTNPRYTHNEAQIFVLPYNSTTFDKVRMLRLIAVFLKQNKKHLNLDKLISISFTCYFDKSTFELKEIIYVVPAGSVSNYSVLGKLTEEIKAKGGLALKDNIKTDTDKYRYYVNKYAANYFIMGMYFNNTDLKPYLNEGILKN